MFANNQAAIQKSEECLEIYSLGHFEIKKGNSIISDDCKRSRSLWNLFNYILAFRDKHIVQEDFFEILWPDVECDNPAKALQNLVYRLRLLIDRNLSTNSGASIINFSQGCYSWNKEFGCWLDTNEFESIHMQAVKAEKNGDKQNAAKLYINAIKLYKGEYLAEYSYNEWIIPIRNHYQRIYLDAVYNLLQIYKSSGEYQEIISVCEKSLTLEPFEERLHQYLIEALIEEGKMKQAQSHYEYVTSMLYKEMGVKPSSELRSLYHRIKMDNGDVSMDLGEIQESLTDKQDQVGAFYCDPDTFQSLYKLEVRRVARSGQSIFIVMLTLHWQRRNAPDNKILKGCIKQLQAILINSLRKGDVVSKWNESQLLALLPGLSFEQTERIIARIAQKFNSTCSIKDILLKTKLQSIEEIQ